jgi:hypothetical protein
MPNALAAEKSPYLRQHADNPVNWLPWGEAAFARACASYNTKHQVSFRVFWLYGEVFLLNFCSLL